MSTTVAFDPSGAIALSSGVSQAGVIRGAPTFYAITIQDSGRLTAKLGPLDGAVNPLSGTTRLTLLSPDRQVLIQSDGQAANNPNDFIDLHLPGSSAGNEVLLGSARAGQRYRELCPDRRLHRHQCSWPTFAHGDCPVQRHDGGLQRRRQRRYRRLPITTRGDVTAYLGTGTARSGRDISWPLYSAQACVVAGDFNNDGHLDLAVANYLTGTISILAGNGDGTFQSSTGVFVRRRQPARNHDRRLYRKRPTRSGCDQFRRQRRCCPLEQR